VFDRAGNIRGVAKKSTSKFIRVRAGGAQAGNLGANARVIAEAMSRAGLAPRDLAAIGITNQRETTVVWNRRTGSPVQRARRQDTRVAKSAAELASGGQISLAPKPACR
jgi:glycerol kinase